MLSRTLETEARYKQWRMLEDAAHDRLVRHARRAMRQSEPPLPLTPHLLHRVRIAWSHVWSHVWSRIRARTTLTPADTPIGDVLPPVPTAHL